MKRTLLCVLTLFGLFLSGCGGWDGLGSEMTRFIRCVERAAKMPTERGVNAAVNVCALKYPNRQYPK